MSPSQNTRILGLHASGDTFVHPVRHLVHAIGNLKLRAYSGDKIWRTLCADCGFAPPGAALCLPVVGTE